MEVNISIDLKRDFDDDNSLLINQSMDDRRASQDGIDYSKEVNLENRIEGLDNDDPVNKTMGDVRGL